MAIASGIRSWLGVVLRELPRYRQALSATDDRYLALCNRHERLQAAPEGKGYRCDWKWTSDLHAPKHVASLGRRLMARMLADHPIALGAAPAPAIERPEVSFVIGHRGEARLPHLFATLRSIAGQQGAGVECVVVEQDVEPRLVARLPAWVRHVHSPPPAADMPYCRSWAFNLGARHAHGSVLVLHDNDILVPRDYAANIVAHVRGGQELINLKRFIFFLSEAHSKDFFAGTAGIADRPPLAIMQNAEGGGSIAISREAFDRIGGMDESFVGWGGEDNEFWERALTARTWPYGCLPLVHLWHAAQPGKHQPGNPALARYRELAEIPVETRIASLRAGMRGNEAGPSGWTPAAPQAWQTP